MDYKKLIAFDFDNTLTKFNVSSHISRGLYTKTNSLPNNLTYNDLISTYTNQIESQYTTDAIFSDLTNNMHFANYLRLLKQKGVMFVVVTYGYHKTVRQLLASRGILDIFSGIYTPADFELLEGHDHFASLQGKNKMLELVASKHSIDKKNILLIDDNYDNIDSARSSKYCTLHIVGKMGIEFRDLTAIEKFTTS